MVFRSIQRALALAKATLRFAFRPSSFKKQHQQQQVVAAAVSHKATELEARIAKLKQELEKEQTEVLQQEVKTGTTTSQQASNEDFVAKQMAEFERKLQEAELNSKVIREEIAADKVRTILESSHDLSADLARFSSATSRTSTPTHAHATHIHTHTHTPLQSQQTATSTSQSASHTSPSTSANAS